MAPKAGVVFSANPVRNYRDFLATGTELSHCHWLFQHNGGVFLPPWGKSEQWMLSVQHTVADVGRFVENIDKFAGIVGALQSLDSGRGETRYA